jgi:glucosamine--fructose-6-phosphate aminotransferase (isomerizing)
LAGKFQIARLGGPYIEAVLCSEFKDTLINLPKNSCVIAVSQSGETADTIEAVRYAKENGAKICSIVNVVGSSLTRYSDNVIITTAGPEVAVASQKAFCTQVTALTMVGLRIAKFTKSLSEEEIKKYEDALALSAEVAQKILDE